LILYLIFYPIEKEFFPATLKKFRVRIISNDDSEEIIQRSHSAIIKPFDFPITSELNNENNNNDNENDHLLFNNST
jgi:hypothetical protein